MAALSIFLHRAQAHRAVTLHPLVSHLLRFWLWFTSGLNTQEWVAVHRKHHAKCDTPEDPHSPQQLGVRRIFRETIELYYAALEDKELLPKYGRGTPDDWVERNLYSRHRRLGVRAMLVIALLLFGPLGLTLWAIQRGWLAFAAGGMINGVGHSWGYRTYASEDYSTNISPIGFFMAGEELHNNHHAHGAVAQFSHQWYEFDVSWGYLKLLSWIGLATGLKGVPPRRERPPVPIADLDMTTLKALITHRYEVGARFARDTRGLYADELTRLATIPELAGRLEPKRLQRWLYVDDPATLTAGDAVLLTEVLGHSAQLHKIYRYRRGLAALWARSTASEAQLLGRLRDWCEEAEACDMPTVRGFSEKLRGYA